MNPHDQAAKNTILRDEIGKALEGCYDPNLVQISDGADLFEGVSDEVMEAMYREAEALAQRTGITADEALSAIATAALRLFLRDTADDAEGGAR